MPAARMISTRADCKPDHVFYVWSCCGVTAPVLSKYHLSCSQCGCQIYDRAANTLKCMQRDASHLFKQNFTSERKSSGCESRDGHDRLPLMTASIKLQRRPTQRSVQVGTLLIYLAHGIRQTGGLLDSSERDNHLPPASFSTRSKGDTPYIMKYLQHIS